jgi:hypothetical protein
MSKSGKTQTAFLFIHMPGAGVERGIHGTDESVNTFQLVFGNVDWKGNV